MLKNRRINLRAYVSAGVLVTLLFWATRLWTSVLPAKQ